MYIYIYIYTFFCTKSTVPVLLQHGTLPKGNQEIPF